ncbi:reductive dehalogenase domain-containing protein [Paremcibacter congregatus]|uniref:reductive dehalogenase domain-containing protein n=1 Tax=Paremcibacter congregatus TaxID=2043170 RepID=UPI0030ED5CB4|tara:strand:- start:925 stop:2118 length:1194 start_codon:yes stop_codon:yes gene_type:complete
MSSSKTENTQRQNYFDHRREIDELTGVEVLETFEKFNQRDDVFCRALWDEGVSSQKVIDFYQGYYMPHAKARKSDGFSQRDYALRNAAWHVCNVLREQKEGRREGFHDHFTSHEEGWPEPYAFESAQQASDDIRKVSAFAGADLVGICAYDARWMYEGVYDGEGKSKPSGIPDDLPHVIVTGESMDKELTSTVPSALAGSATGMGYTNDCVTLLTITQYIRNLGYRAYATMNDSALAVPLAVQAGLGEGGRHSLLITEEYGARLRLGKIFTDMPLVHDAPKSFGVKEFCDVCNRCAKGCPPKAISFDPPSDKIFNRSNLKGVVKWTTDAEKCFRFWVNQNTDCSICIRVCPYNRDYTKWVNRVWQKLAGSRFRRFALWLDDRFHPRPREKSADWWGN